MRTDPGEARKPPTNWKIWRQSTNGLPIVTTKYRSLKLSASELLRWAHSFKKLQRLATPLGLILAECRWVVSAVYISMAMKMSSSRGLMWSKLLKATYQSVVIDFSVLLSTLARIEERVNVCTMFLNPVMMLSLKSKFMVPSRSESFLAVSYLPSFLRRTCPQRLLICSVVVQKVLNWSCDISLVESQLQYNTSFKEEACSADRWAYHG